MGFVYATIDLINGVDLLDARRHMIREDEIRRMSVRMECDVVSWVEIKFGNPRANCDAHVLPECCKKCKGPGNFSGAFFMR
jgi:hypothetical protein